MSIDRASKVDPCFTSQPDDLRPVPSDERDRLIITAIEVDGAWTIKSRYGDDTWELAGGTSNRAKSERRIKFTLVPREYRSQIKEVMYRYLRRGVEGGRPPALTTAFIFFSNLVLFLDYLSRFGIKSLSAVTTMICLSYVSACKAERTDRGSREGKPLAPKTLSHRFLAVEHLYALSQYSTTPIPSEPWPSSSSLQLAGLLGSTRNSKTPLIPDDVFCTIFSEAYALVLRGTEILDLRDELDALEAGRNCQPRDKRKQRRRLKARGWEGGVKQFNKTLFDLRTACFIVIASLSGCRSHELCYVRTEAYTRTEDDDGHVYWWMRSQSDKTFVGETEWMVPEAAVKALKVMDRWAAPYQIQLGREIATRRSEDRFDPEIFEAQRHVGAVFIGPDLNKSNQIRTLSCSSLNKRLKEFVRRCGMDWDLTTLQFRRKFANYAARSKFGDLRYLREHFKHWSQDMTNDGYALNESQEMELYAEIQEELDTLKLGVAEQWLNPTEPLAGGYGKNLADWRRRDENVVLFKDHATMVRSVAESHAIRSNGHAWCTADDRKCIGNSFEKTRCSGCDNGVIGRSHARLYQRLYDDLKEVRKCRDIGPGGQARVQRDIERCRDVLISLGYDPETSAA